MKAVSLFIFTFLLSGRILAADSLAVNLGADTVTVAGGETAAIDIGIRVSEGFDASLYLSFSAPDLIQEKPALSSTVINSLYKNARLMVKTLAGFNMGVHSIVVEAKNGNLAASDTVYLNIIKSTRWRVIPVRSFPAIVPRHFTQDREGYFWTSKYALGSGFVSGVFRLSPDHKDTVFYPSESGAAPLSYEIAFDSRNRGWFAASHLYRFDDKYWSVWKNTDSPLPGLTQTLAIDSSDNVWAGTDKGLARFNGSEWTVFNTGNSPFGSEWIYAVRVDTAGVVWVGAESGLGRYDGNEWKKFTRQNSNLKSNYVRRIAIEKSGILWLALGEEGTPHTDFYHDPRTMLGIARFDGQSFTHFDKSTGLPTNFISSIVIDRKNNKWFSTAPMVDYVTTFPKTAYGLLKYDDKAWTAFDTTNAPMPDNLATWVGVDDSNNIWASYATGYITVFNEDGLPGFLMGPATGVEENLSAVPLQAGLAPNPAGNFSLLRYTLDKSSFVEISLSNLKGERVAAPVRIESQGAGEYSLPLNLAELPPGVYLCTLATRGAANTIKLLVSK